MRGSGKKHLAHKILKIELTFLIYLPQMMTRALTCWFRVLPVFPSYAIRVLDILDPLVDNFSAIALWYMKSVLP